IFTGRFPPCYRLLILPWFRNAANGTAGPNRGGKRHRHPRDGLGGGDGERTGASRSVKLDLADLDNHLVAVLGDLALDGALLRLLADLLVGIRAVILLVGIGVEVVEDVLVAFLHHDAEGALLGPGLLAVRAH